MQPSAVSSGGPPLCILKGAGIIFLLGGALALIAGVASGFRTQNLVQHGLTAPGVVIENVREEQVNYDQNTHARTVSYTYRPKVRFRPQNGEEVVFESRVGFGRPSYQKGETIDVLYDPSDPHSAEIKSFWSLWLNPILLGCFAAIFLVVGVGIRTWLSRMLAATSGNASRNDPYKPIE